MLGATMRAAVITRPNVIEVQDIPKPRAEAGWVVIAPVASGVCGTDLHLVTGDYPLAKLPIVPGHEFAGYVTEVGSGVTGVKVGDYVGVDPNITCGKCRLCRMGAMNLCEDNDLVGVTVNGAVAEFIAVPSNTVFKLSSSVTHEAAPLIEPLSCVLHALERVPDWRDQQMVIFGAGSIGLMVATLAKAEKAAGVRVIDPNVKRHQMVQKLDVGLVATSIDELDLQTFDIAVDASGHPAAITAAFNALGKRGRLLQMGVASPTASIQISPYEIFAKEISIIGSQSLAGKYAEAAERMVDLQKDLKQLVTANFSIEEYEQAVGAAMSPDNLKVQIVN